MNFVEAVQTVLTTNYANFNSRSARPEFWWYVLFSIIVSAVFYFLVKAVPAINYVQMIYGLATLIPGIAVAVRRLMTSTNPDGLSSSASSLSSDGSY